MSGYFYITCKNTGKVLDVEGSGKPAPSAFLLAKEKDEARQTQLWKWDTEGRLINKADNKLVADIKNNKNEAGAFVTLESLWSYPYQNQRWRVRGHSIHSELNNMVMDASDSYLRMKNPGESKHQTWEFIPEEIHYFYIISEKYEWFLDSAINFKWGILTTSPRSEEDTQLWRWDGNCLVNKQGLAADIEYEDKKATTPVILSSQTGNKNQQWKLDNGEIRSMLNDLVMDA